MPDHVDDAQHMLRKETRALKPGHLQARAMPETADDEARTVDVVWSTGADVKRLMYVEGRGFQPVIERLLMGADNVELSRLNDGASVLRDHKNNIDSVVGVVENARLENGQGVATIRLDDADDALWQRVKSGIVRHISVGYVIHEMEIQDPEERDGPYLGVVSRWEPNEISFVAVPADPAAGVRAAEKEYPATIVQSVTKKENDMPDKNNQAAAERSQDNAAGAPEQRNSQPETPAVDEKRIMAKAQKAERERIAAIQRRGQSVGVDVKIIQDCIDNGLTPEKAAERFIDALADKPESTPKQRVEQGFSNDDPAVIQERLSSVLAARMQSKPVEDEAARQYAGASAMDVMQIMLEARGERVSAFGAPDRRFKQLMQAMKRTHTTSDFSNVVANAAGKVLMNTYEVAPRAFTQYSARRDYRDFKDSKAVKVGDYPSLEQVADGGEIEYGTVSDNGETSKLISYGRIVSMSRQLIINDDLGAFADVLRNAGRAATRLENRIASALLTDNSGAGANMADGNPLFHASRNNTDTGTLTNANIGKLFARIRKQKADGSSEPLGLEPAILVVGPNLETKALQLMAEISADSGSNANIWRQRLRVVVDSSITGNAFYVFCDPAIAPALRHGYLEGTNGAPRVETQQGFDVEGLKIKVAHDFGAGVVDGQPTARSTGS